MKSYQRAIPFFEKIEAHMHGGGVLLAVSNEIPSKLLINNTPSDIEGVTVEINHTNP